MVIEQMKNLSIKRLLDLVISISLIILTLPLLLIISISIKVFSEGPILHWSKRVGKNNVIFNMPKFRTMSVNTPQLATHLLRNPKKNITKIGFFLRKSSLDEIPQLWSVIIGDMSLVGPRPDVPGYADKLNKKEKKITSIRPGITGPASLEYANEEYLLSKVKSPKRYNDKVIYPNKIKINLHYIENWSFFLDLKLILKTIFRKDY